MDTQKLKDRGLEQGDILLLDSDSEDIYTFPPEWICQNDSKKTLIKIGGWEDEENMYGDLAHNGLYCGQ